MLRLHLLKSNISKLTGRGRRFTVWLRPLQRHGTAPQGVTARVWQRHRLTSMAGQDMDENDPRVISGRTGGPMPLLSARAERARGKGGKEGLQRLQSRWRCQMPPCDLRIPTEGLDKSERDRWGAPGRPNSPVAQHQARTLRARGNERREVGAV